MSNTMNCFTVEELANLKKVMKVLGSDGLLSGKTFEQSDIKQANETTSNLVKLKLQDLFPPEPEPKVA